MLADDRDWLYSNIGVGVTEIGTFDLVLLEVPGRGPPSGWRRGSPTRARPGCCPMRSSTRCARC